MGTKLLEVLGLQPLTAREGAPENLADLQEDAEADEALRLVALQKRLDALREPRGAEGAELAALARARTGVQATLSARDAALAARELDQLVELDKDIRVTIDARHTACLDALRAQLAELKDPAGLNELAADPLKPLRERAAKALTAGDSGAAEVAIEALAEAIPLAAEAILEARRARVETLREQFAKLPIPPGAEQAESDILLPLREAVQKALDALQPDEAMRHLEALRLATEQAIKAIEERRRQKLAALQKRLDSFVPVEGATSEEGKPLADRRKEAAEAIAGGGVQLAENALTAFVKQSRATNRAVQRRLAGEKADDAQRKQDAKSQAARAAAEDLRAWIFKNIFDRNIDIQQTGGPVCDTPLSDAASEMQALDPAQLNAEIAKLAGEKAALDVAHAFALRVKAVREGTPKRLEDLGKKILRCDTLKAEVDAAAVKSINRLGGKKEVTEPLLKQVRLQLADIDKQKAALTTKRQTLATLNPATLTSNPAAQALLLAAETILNGAEPAPAFNKVTDLKTAMTSEPAADELLQIGKTWVGKELDYRTIEPILKDAIPKKLPSGIFDARLKVALDVQMKIAPTDVGKILGLGDGGNLYVRAEGVYSGRNCHLSLYKTVYKGKASWDQEAAKILDQLVGPVNETGNVHITWEWTGQQDAEENLKVYRNGWNGPTGHHAYKNNVGGWTAAEVERYAMPDIGGPYPLVADAEAALYTKLKDACTGFLNIIKERRLNKGLSDTEKAANTADKLKLPEG